MENKALREAVAASELEKDKNLFRRELDWVRRMPKARTTKSKSRVEAFDDLEARIKNQRHKTELNISMRMERMGSKILELHHVSKSYGEKKLLSDFNYIFKRKEKVGIVGPNGVGKSTFLNMIMELEKPDSGKIVTGDTMIFGYYSQTGIKVDDSKKVIDVVRDIADWIPMANGNKLTAQQLLLQCGFSHEKQWDFVLKLSGGEKRRLYLMTILMKAPNFLILDEPTTGLDPNQLVEIRSVIKNVGKNKTVFLSTHIMQEVEAMCSRVIIINKGSIVANGGIEQLRNNQSLNQITVKVEFSSAISETWFTEIPEVLSFSTINSTTFEIVGNSGDLREKISRKAAEKGDVIIALQQEENSLEFQN